ncbi:MAG: class I SAM-dependent methyltransferase [Candidatus Thorarchaeota archaeon]
MERLELITDIPDGLRESGAIEVREKLGTISGGDVLDVGTEDGGFIETLMKTLNEYNSFTGVDISDEDLNKARERFKDAPVKLIEMNAEVMTFPDNQFDTVCMSYVIHHLENIDTVLAEMYRVLKPGGHFIIQEMYSDGDQTAAQLVDRDVHNLDVKADTLLGIPHFESLTRQSLRNLVDKIGLNDIQCFESSWSVKCLFCEDALECENPTRADNIEFVTKQIDESLAKVREHASYDVLREEAESLKERVKVDGSSAASLMYFIGKK